MVFSALLRDSIPQSGISSTNKAKLETQKGLLHRVATREEVEKAWEESHNKTEENEDHDALAQEDLNEMGRVLIESLEGSTRIPDVDKIVVPFPSLS